VQPEPGEEPAEGNENDSLVDELPSPSKITIGDKEYDPDELPGLISKGEDYTRKTQELSQQRKAMKENAAQYVLSAINNYPVEQRKALVAEFAQMNGLTVVDPSTGSPVMGGQLPQQQGIPAAPTVEWDELSEEGKMLYAQNLQLMTQLKQLTPMLGEVQSYIGNERQTKEQQSAIAQSSVKIKEQTGADVSSSDFQEAIQATGIADPFSAWWAHNGPKVAQGAFVKGKQVASAKPNTPTSNSKTFDPNEQNPDGTYRYPTPESIDRMIQRGFMPTRR
jgi:hypothetical protein